MQLKLFFVVGRAATVHPQLLQPKIQYNSGTKGIHARPQSAPAVGLLGPNDELIFNCPPAEGTLFHPLLR